jgi:hypothetical protein
MIVTVGYGGIGPGLTTPFFLFGRYGNGIRCRRFRMLRVDGRVKTVDMG